MPTPEMSEDAKLASSLHIAKMTIISVLIVVFSPILLIVLGLWRLVAVALIKAQYKEATLVTGVDNFFTYIDDNRQNCVRVIMMCTGKPDMACIRPKVLNDFALVYANLRRYFVRKYGFAYWKQEENFDIDDHLFWRPDLTMSCQQDEHDVHDKLVRMPFKPGISPWRFVVIPHAPDYKRVNGEPSYTIILVYNHIIGDGHSIFQALTNALFDEKFTYPEPKRQKIPMWQRAASLACSLVYFPYLTAELITSSWNMFRDKDMPDKINVLNTNVKVADIKLVKNATRTTFFAVLLTCFMGALRKHLVRHSIPVPKYFYSALAYVHRDSNELTELANNYILSGLRVPMVAKGSAKDRLLAIAGEMGSLYNQALKFHGGFFMGSGLNLVPKPLGAYCANNFSTSSYMAIAGMDAPNSSIFGNGNKVHILGGALSLNRKQGIGFTGITKQDQTVIILNISPLLLNGLEEADLFLKDIEDELNDLVKLTQ